jgi:N-acyl-D-aspartate/D-glutamate deacylase
MHDTLIKGGRVVDGTGAPPRTADVAIRDGRIAEIGRIASPARQTIDADGAIVTPGFIDPHTHYDGQITWDDRFDQSFPHGVTTVIAGNCGVGFAPVRPEHRQELVQLMEGVEDIPGVTLTEGMSWDWRSFGDYLDRLADRRYTMDVAAHLTHSPLRVFVMGERALRHEDATADDLEAMCRIVREAMAAGAMGFSNGRIVGHRSSTGNHVPGTFAAREELIALARAMGESGRGVFQVVPNGAVGDFGGQQLGREGRLAEHRLYEEIVAASGRPLTYSLVQFASDPGDFEMMLGESRRAYDAGLRIYPQTSTRGGDLLTTLDGYHLFLMRPSYRAIERLPLAERARAMRDPAVRAAILSEADELGDYAQQPAVLAMLRHLPPELADTYVLRSPLDYEPTPDRKVGALARAAGKTPEEFIYDFYAEGDGRNFNVTVFVNYAQGSLDFVPPALAHPNVVCGLGDGGAHVKLITDSALPTFQIAFWTRERTRGERLPVETVVNKLTAAPAELYGLGDRGVLAPGKRADLNVIDLDRLNLSAPHIAHDLPGGAPRLLQESQGYLATLVAGEATRLGDADTGARPGRLLRGTAAAA